MNMKKIVLIAAGVLLLAGLIIGALFLFNSGKDDAGDSKRENILLLSRDYADQGEYQRALNLLDTLLLENPDDPQARDLRDTIIQEKKEREEKDRQTELDELRAQNDELKQGLDNLSQSLNQETPEEKEARLKREEERRKKELEKDLQVEELLDQAKKALKDKDFDKAIDLAKQALRIKPDSYEARNLKDKAEKEREDSLSAAEKAEKERQEKEIKGLLKDMQEALDDQNYTETRKLADKIKKLDPQRPEPYLYSGKSWYLQDPDSSSHRRDAEEELEKALDKDPGQAEAYYLLGMIKYKEKDYSRAEDNFEKAVSLDSGKDEYWYRLGVTQYRQKRYQKALTSFKKCENINPRFTGNAFNMGLTLKRLNRNSEALAAFKKSSEYRPDHAPSFWESGKLLYAAEDYSSAVRFMSSAVKFSPEKVDYQNGLAAAYYNMDNFTSALQHYKEALNLEKNSLEKAEIEYNIALCYNQAGDFSNGLKSIASAIKKSPEAKYYFTMGEASEGLGSTDQALQLYTKAIEKDPNYAKPYINMGAIYDEKGDYEEAKKLLERAYRIDSDDIAAWNNLGNVYLHLKDYENSIHYYSKALSIQPDDTNIMYHISLAYSESEQKDKAEKTLQKLLKKDSRYWSAYELLAQIQFALGKKEDASETASTLLQKKPDYENRELMEPLIIK